VKTSIAIALFSASVFAQVSPVIPSTDFVTIQPGTFKMGCSAGDMRCDPDENPPHQVKLTKPFQLAKYEVTQAQWKAVMGDNNPSRFKGETLPVENISFDQVQEFLKRLNATNDGFVYRLPAEAEWEYAARAGTLGPNTGSLDEVAWHAGNSEMKSHPVGQKKPNAWGLYDMEGNVYEWTNDWFFDYEEDAVTDPRGPETGFERVPRGAHGTVHLSASGLPIATNSNLMPATSTLASELHEIRVNEIQPPSVPRSSGAGATACSRFRVNRRASLPLRSPHRHVNGPRRVDKVS
jgi:formylglycine-generating enzyme required for sulfatase activity